MSHTLLFLLPLILGRAWPSQPAPDTPTSRPDLAELAATEIGIRFTPQMARAMSRRFVQGMKSRYDLDDRQASDIEALMARQFVDFAQSNAERGRDVIEFMMATMIENDGRFPRDDAKAFSKLVQPLIPKIQDFVRESSAAVGQKMTVTQRLKFTADVTVAAAGVTIFDARMKRWNEGKVGDFANPFFDPGDTNPAKTESQPVDPSEHPEYRRARLDAEQWIDLVLDVDQNWENYVNQTIEYYKLNDAQKTAARAILKECRDRARAIKTPQWRETAKQNRIARQLLRRSARDLDRGPVMFAIESEFTRLRKPLMDLEDELKRRLEEIPDSTQRAAARQAVRKILAERGMTHPPL